MKALLRFDLPADQYELDAALHGEDYKRVLRDFDEHLRQALDSEAEPIQSFVEKLRLTLRELADGHGVAAALD